MKKITLAFSYLLLVLSLTSCDLKKDYTFPTPKGDTVLIPEDTVLISFVDKQGTSHTMLANGEELKACELCPPGQEKRCAESTSGEYCEGLVDATVSIVTTTTRILSHINPYCWTEIEGGSARQRCVCYPGETHKLCL